MLELKDNFQIKAFLIKLLNLLYADIHYLRAAWIIVGLGEGGVYRCVNTKYIMEKLINATQLSVALYKKSYVPFVASLNNADSL